MIESCTLNFHRSIRPNRCIVQMEYKHLYRTEVRLNLIHRFWIDYLCKHQNQIIIRTFRWKWQTPNTVHPHPSQPVLFLSISFSLESLHVYIAKDDDYKNQTVDSRRILILLLRNRRMWTYFLSFSASRSVFAFEYMRVYYTLQPNWQVWRKKTRRQQNKLLCRKQDNRI